MTIKRKLSESAIDQENGSERRLRSGRTTFVTTFPVTNTKSTGSPSRSPRKRIQPLKPDVAQKDERDDVAEYNSEFSLKSLKTPKRREIRSKKVSKNRSDAATVTDQLIPMEEALQFYGDYGAGKESSSTSIFFLFKLLKTRS